MNKAPMVFCPKEKKKVPIWHCAGSFMQQRETCSNMIQVTIYKGAKRAKVKCELKGEKR